MSSVQLICLFVRHFSELMLLGFVSLLLVVFQDLIQKICIDESLMEHGWPCRGGNEAAAAAHHGAAPTFAGTGRRMLKGGATFGHCSSKVTPAVVVVQVDCERARQWARTHFDR